MINHDAPTQVVILRKLLGGMLVFLLSPLLLPLVVGTIITRAIHGISVSARRLGADRGPP